MVMSSVECPTISITTRGGTPSCKLGDAGVAEVVVVLLAFLGTSEHGPACGPAARARRARRRRHQDHGQRGTLSSRAAIRSGSRLGCGYGAWAWPLQGPGPFGVRRRSAPARR